MKKKVVIIGAGPAGLTCAYELLKRSSDYEVVILEKDKQVGGISRTVTYNNNKMDLGGHRFFSKNEYINKIWQEILPVKNDSGNDKVFLIRNRISRIFYANNFFDYPITLSLSTISKMGFITTLKSGFSYFKSVLFKRKETNLENFYINRFGEKLYSLFFLKYTEKVWGRSPKDISPDWGSQRAKGLSIYTVLKSAIMDLFHISSKNRETSLIESFYYPKYGPGQLWEEMALIIQKKGVKIITEAEVVHIKKIKNKITELVYMKDGEKIKISADIFVSSMPLKNLISSTNNIPKKIKDVADSLPYRDFMTLGLVVKKLNLKNETNIRTTLDIVPDCWIYIQEPDVLMGRIQIFNNWSPYLVSDSLNTVSLGLEYFCNAFDELWCMSDEEFKNFAISELEKMKMIDKNDVVCYHVERVEKAYPAYFDGYQYMDLLIDYLNKIENLYCIGRNGQHRYNNMDHSMLTAIYTVDDILDGCKDKDKIWKVNTEKEYLEDK